MRSRRIVLGAAVALAASAAAAWAQYTVTPPSVFVTCGSGSTIGSSPFTIQSSNGSGSGSNTLTMNPVGTCPGFDVAPTPWTFDTPGSHGFTASVMDPTGTSCTFEMQRTAPPIVDPLQTFTVQAMNCGGMAGTITVSPETISFPSVQMGSVGTTSFFVFNNTGGYMTSVRYQVTSGGPFEVDCPPPDQYDCTKTFLSPGVPNMQQVMPPPILKCNALGVPPADYSGTLTVTAFPGGQMDTSGLACHVTAAGTGPQISVSSPVTIGPVEAYGATTRMMSIPVTNSFSPGPDLVLSMLTESGGPIADWSYGGCSMPCTIPAGQSRPIVVMFDPAALGDRSITLTIVNNDAEPADQMKNVSLIGSGIGGDVTAVPANDATIDFGQQPVMMTSTARTIRLTNAGDLAIDATPSSLPGDFTVTPSGPTPVPAHGSLDFDVRCVPQTTGDKMATLILQAPENMASPQQLAFTYHLQCEGIVATLELDPTSLAFGPIRVDPPGTTSAVMDIMIHNPGGSPVSVGPLSMVSGTHFQVSGFATGTAEMLGGGATEIISVTFDPAAEGTILEDDIRGIEMDRLVRVTGAGVVPDYQVVPTEAAIGRVCVGDPVVQMFSLEVRPTADIEVTGVALGGDPRFMMWFVDPLGYPQTLSPTETATVGITVTAELGNMTEMLTWTTDVTPAQRVVPIQLEGIADGLSVTPVAVDFGPQPVGERSAEMRPTLKSCGTDTFEVSAELRDNDSGAFLLSGPASATITNVASMPWGVSFAPATEGRHTATLRLTPSDGERVDIELIGGGQGVNETPPGTTSYYACGCDAPLDAGGGVAGAIVIVVLARPRRRRQRP